MSGRLRLLYRLIDGLNLMQKAMVMLYLDRNSHQEIAEVRGIAASNVAARMNRLKNDWKQKMGQTNGPEKDDDNV